MTQAALLWTVAALSGALAGFGALAERRHKARKDLDRVGLVNWSMVTVIGTCVGMLCLAYAIKVTLSGSSH